MTVYGSHYSLTTGGRSCRGVGIPQTHPPQTKDQLPDPVVQILPECPQTPPGPRKPAHRPQWVTLGGTSHRTHLIVPVPPIPHLNKHADAHKNASASISPMARYPSYHKGRGSNQRKCWREGPTPLYYRLYICDRT